MGLTSRAGKLLQGKKKKTADESMSDIRFRTTPKGDSPHYLYIFMRPEPLGTKMKNVACSRLGTMLHLEIQKGKEAMKKSTQPSSFHGYLFE